MYRVLFSVLMGSVVLGGCASPAPKPAEKIVERPTPLKVTPPPVGERAAPPAVWTVRELPHPITRDPVLMGMKAPKAQPSESSDPEVMPEAQALPQAQPQPSASRPLKVLEGPDAEGGFMIRRSLYYDTDSASVPSNFRAVVLAHALFLAKHPELQVKLEGHCDERGSHEYNLSLGERRALGIKQLMMLSGAGAENIKIESFGKERPVALGHNEKAWSRNRRVDISYGDEP